MPHQFQISRDSQALYITIIAKDRLPVFRTDAIKAIVCRALDEARSSGNFLLFAYVIMLDHLHLITNQPTTSSDVLRRIKGITAKAGDRLSKGKQLWSVASEVTASSVEARTQIFPLATGEKCILNIQRGSVYAKVNYIHQNPVRAGLVESANDYQWSSARIWQGCSSEDEPLQVDIDRIAWRSKGAAR